MTLSTLAPARRPHRILAQKPGPWVPDPDGGMVQSWIDLIPPGFSAQILPATPTNMERLGPSGSVQVRATLLINVPYHKDLTTQVRLIHAARQFFVSGVRNVDEANVELWLAVEERAQ